MFQGCKMVLYGNGWSCHIYWCKNNPKCTFTRWENWTTTWIGHWWYLVCFTWIVPWELHFQNKVCLLFFPSTWHSLNLFPFVNSFLVSLWFERIEPLPFLHGMLKILIFFICGTYMSETQRRSWQFHILVLCLTLMLRGTTQMISTRSDENQLLILLHS